MKKILSIILTFAICFSSMITFAVTDVSASTAVNIIANNDFEDSATELNGWNTWSNVDTSQFSVDSTDKVTGNNSAKIFNNVNAASAISQTFVLEAGKQYKVEAMMKTDSIATDNPNDGAMIGVVGKKDTGDWTFEQKSSRVIGTNDWSKVELNITVPAETATIEIALRVWGASGTAWFDDVIVTESIPDPVPNANIIANSSFEDSATELSSWSTWSNVDTSQFSVDSTEKVTGNNAAKISNGVNAASAISQTFVLEAGKQYKVEAMMKTDSVATDNPNDGAMIGVVGKKSTGDWTFEQKSSRVIGTNDWSKVELNITVPAETATIEIALRVWGASGTAWFDDVKVTENIPDTQPDETLVKNPGFENGTSINDAADWATFTNANENQSVESLRDDSIKYSGNFSAKITQSENGIASNFNQNIKVEPGKIYVLSGYIKAENVSDIGDGAILGAVIRDSSMSWVSEFNTTAIHGTEDWVRVEKKFLAPPNAESVDISIRLWGSSGTAWFDDIAFEQESTTEMTQNSGFETGTDMPENWNTWSNTQSGTSPFNWVTDMAYAGNKCVKITNTENDASGWSQDIPVTVGQQYIIEGWIKSEDVSDIGDGAILAVIYRTQTAELVGEIKSTAVRGTNDWTKVTKLITIPEGVKYIQLGARLWGSTGTAWFDDVKIKPYDSSDIGNIPEGNHTLTISTTPNSQKLDGFGAEWDPKFWNEDNISKGVTEADWSLITERIKKMGLQKVRIMVLPESYEPDNDNSDPFNTDLSRFTFDSKDMQILKRYLDVCEELKIDVVLTWWCAQTIQNVENPWLAYDKPDSWCTAPNNNDEAAENISALLNYLINTKKYTCISDLIIFNEPAYGFINQQGAVDFNSYVDLYKKVDARLKSDNLRSKIKLVGSDDGGSVWFTNTVKELDSVLDKYDSHSYAWTVNDPDFSNSVQGFVDVRTSRVQKPYFFGEFGTENTVGAYTATDVDTYDRGLFLPAHAINNLKAGGSGQLYWSLHDVYYKTTSDPNVENGGKMKTGLWAYKDENWRTRPTYYSWGLINKYTEVGSEIYNIDGTPGYMDAVSLKSPSGKLTILAVNRTKNPQHISLANVSSSSALDTYVFSEAALPTTDDMISSSGKVSADNGTLSFTIPAWSFIVLSDLDKTNNDSNHHNTPTIPVSETNTNVSVNIDGNKSTAIISMPVQVINNDQESVKLSAKQFKDALDALNKTGSANKKAIVIKVDNGNDTDRSLSIDLPKSAFSILDNNISSLKIETGSGTIFFDSDALEQINKEASENVTLSIEKKASGNYKLKGKDIIADRPVYSYEMRSGNNLISDIKKGSITIGIPYSNINNDDINAIVGCYISDDGKISKVKHSMYDEKDQCLYININSFSNYAVGCEKINLEDVKNHWAKDSITYLTTREIMDSSADGKFNPDTSITRSEFIKIICKMVDADTSNYTKQIFKDVPAQSEYSQYIAWANENNIIKGIGNNKFGPDGSITREQIAIILTRLAKVIGCDLPKINDPIDFTDMDNLNSVSYDSITAIQQAGIVSGKPNNIYDPKANASKAEIAKMICYFMKKVL